jgi:DNA-binding CsgD family transcriptional regulator/PAS domain-containing protein
LTTTSHIRNAAHDPLGHEGWSEIGGPIAERLRSLSGLLNNTTVGVAFFDRSLRCTALNGAFARMIGTSATAHVGRALRQLFPTDAASLEPAFQHVWSTGSSLSNFELTMQFPAEKETRRWLVNFYPIGDAHGEFPLIAATFCEITKTSSAEVLLDRLTDRFRSGAVEDATVLGEDFAELSARTLALVQRSVGLLKSSGSLRCYVSEMRLEAGLERLALYLYAAPRQTSASPSAPPSAQSPADRITLAPPLNPSALPAGTPSFRERQVLLLLAEGKSNKEIASALDLSTRTVESYRARIMQKLGLHSTAALVRYAVRNRLVEP